MKFVEQMDLDAFYDAVKSRGSEPGRPATDPAMQIALWLFATSEGVGSGRQLERLCDRDDAYRWICGGVHVNYHTLSDFRVGHGNALDELMTQALGDLGAADELIRTWHEDYNHVRPHSSLGGQSPIEALARRRVQHARLALTGVPDWC